MTYPDVTGMVEQHALPSAVIAFGLGLGVGLALAGLLVPALPAPQQKMTERLGRQLVDALAAVLPESVTGRK
jgi:hypothetical protein